LTSAIALENLARIDFQQEQEGQAGTRYAEALVLYNAVGDWPGISSCLAGVATIAARRGHHQTAARLLAAASAYAEAAGLGDQTEPEHISQDELRAMLGDEVFSATWLVGQGLAVDRVVAEATAFILETSAA
jgi:hypothetical protein